MLSFIRHFVVHKSCKILRTNYSSHTRHPNKDCQPFAFLFFAKVIEHLWWIDMIIARFLFVSFNPCLWFLFHIQLNLSGGLPGVYAVLDVSNPGVFLQRVDGFQDVLSPVFHLWKQPNGHTLSSVQRTTWGYRTGRASSFSNNLLLYSNYICNRGRCINMVVKWLQFLP